MSVVGYYSNEMTLHLIKSYCVPSVLYGCETWYLDRHDYRRLNVLWNNSFRKICKCCWRENVSHLLFYCHTFPVSYLADLRKILFWKKALICDNVIVRTLANISKCSIGLILSKYYIQSISVNINDIKLRMWKHFVDDCAEHGRVTFY